jgi:tRNA pseudouridine55 synthase
MDGILVINKPLGLSSHDCVSKVRKIYQTKKVGHSGTLDQEATGVLVMGINKGTKLLNYLNQDDKIYAFTIKFGVLTDTLDHTGKVIKKESHPDLSNLNEVVKSFIGTYHQTPPAFSAVKVKGKKLYEYARTNQAIPEVAPRQLTIYDLKLTSSDFMNTHEVDCVVHASKGLYVRKLALDIATKLGTVAITTRIHRIKAGAFTISEAIDLDALTRDHVLISMSDALKDMAAVKLSPSLYFSVKNGQKIELNTHHEQVKLVDEANQLLAIYERKDDHYYPKNVFM